MCAVLMCRLDDDMPAVGTVLFCQLSSCITDAYHPDRRAPSLPLLRRHAQICTHRLALSISFSQPNYSAGRLGSRSTFSAFKSPNNGLCAGLGLFLAASFLDSVMSRNAMDDVANSPNSSRGLGPARAGRFGGGGLADMLNDACRVNRRRMSGDSCDALNVDPDSGVPDKSQLER